MVGGATDLRVHGSRPAKSNGTVSALAIIRLSLGIGCARCYIGMESGGLGHRKVPGIAPFRFERIVKGVTPHLTLLNQS